MKLYKTIRTLSTKTLIKITCIKIRTSKNKIIMKCWDMMNNKNRWKNPSRTNYKDCTQWKQTQRSKKECKGINKVRTESMNQ